MKESISTPKVSIITPHFERVDLLLETAGSVRSSQFEDWEWLIVDDGSSPLAWEQVQALADGGRIKVLRREHGCKGPNACRNLGLAHATSHYVLFLDSDDLLAPWCLDARISEAEQRPDADLWVFPALLFHDKPGDSDLLWNAMKTDKDDLGRFLRSDPPWCVSSPIWRREALQQIGGLNEAIGYGTDADLHMRALVSGLRVLQYPDAMPDVLVRRSNAPRITNSLSPSLIETRRARLREGTRFLSSRSETTQPLAVWEGQYFVEAEFLLFNHTPAYESVARVLDDWEMEFFPGLTRRMIVRGYFALALASRHHAYMLLRLARRTAMKLLPADYFPSGGHYHTARADVTMMTTLLERLSMNPDVQNTYRTRSAPDGVAFQHSGN